MYGKKLRELRKLEGWTQKEVADKIGVSKQTYSHYENEKRKPSLEMIRELANVYKVDIDQVFGFQDEIAFSSNTIRLPLYGDISAGALSAIEGLSYYETHFIELPVELLGNYYNADGLFVMRTNGESMNKIIPDKSYAIFRKCKKEDLKDDDIVIYSYDGEYGMKRFRRDDEDQVVIFSPDSTDKKFRDMIIPYDTMNDLIVFGKLVIYVVTYR